MLSSKIKDIKIRKSFSKTERLLKKNKFIFIFLLNKYKSSIKKKNLIFSVYKLLSKSLLLSKTKITNRCVINNRGRGILRPFGISRVLLRELMQFGILPGFKKAVW